MAVHIDRGRDPGPFGTPAHYPILIGLFGIFASGWLALVMARDGTRDIFLNDGSELDTSAINALLAQYDDPDILVAFSQHLSAPIPSLQAWLAGDVC